MAGKVPVLIEVDVQPMAWFDFVTMAEFNANMNLSGEFTFKQTFEVDIDDVKFEAKVPRFDAVPIRMDKLTVVGKFNADATMRVGPRITFSINKVPISQDIVAKIIASTELSASTDSSSGQACATGSAEVQGGLDFRTSISFPGADLGPLSLSTEICSNTLGTTFDLAGGFVNIAGDCVNAGVNLMADRADCFTNSIGVNSKIKDDTQKLEFNHGFDAEMASDLCEQSVDLFPKEIQDFASSVSTEMDLTGWSSLTLFQAGIEDGICAESIYSGSAASSSAVWTVTSNGSYWHSSASGVAGTWKKVNCCMSKQLAVSADGNHVWGVQSNGFTAYNTNSGVDGHWKNFKSCCIKHISVSAYSNHIWAVIDSGIVFYKNGIGGSWQQVHGNNMRQIAVSADGNHIWAVTEDNRLWYRPGFNGYDGYWRWKSSYAKYVAVNGDGSHVWVVGSNGGSIHHKAGADGGWQRISGSSVKQLSVSANGSLVWAVTDNNAMYYRHGVDGDWFHHAGAAVQVEVA